MSPERPHDESELRQADELFRLMMESSPAAVVIVDDAGRIVLVNHQTENWFGYDRSELIGQDIEILMPHRFHDQHRSDRDRFHASPQTRPMGAGKDLFARRKDGNEFPVDISLHPMKMAEGMLVMAHIVNLTDRKRAEVETQRRHSLERLALLGQLAGGVAHEIRNPLGVIRNAAYYLQMIQETLDDDAQASIAEIQLEVDHANHIVGDLLDYARDPPQRTMTFNLVARVRQLVDKQRDALATTIKVDAASETILVAADPDQIDRILVNLIRNAVQASPDASQISISLKDDADMAIIDVSDDGAGIAEADRPRIFEPLFSTKAKGFGLGLVVSKRYAERNGGSLELVDDTATGSTFRLTLPLTPPQKRGDIVPSKDPDA